MHGEESLPLFALAQDRKAGGDALKRLNGPVFRAIPGLDVLLEVTAQEVRVPRGLVAPLAADEIVDGEDVGGILVAYELARALGIRAIYAERQDGKMTLRRGFAIRPGERILLCEDVVTTGGSLLEVRDLVTAAGGQVIAVASLVNRTSGRDTGLGLPLTALLKIDVPAYTAEECPMCRAGQPLVSPGRTGKK